MGKLEPATPAGVFAKLNLKAQQDVVVLNAPQSFAPELARLTGVRIRRTVPSREPVAFALAFVTRQDEVDALARTLTARADGDAIVWFAYPKGSSKRYTSRIDRDTGWQALGTAGFEAVRAVAIDEDWSAVRFRRVEFIKTMKRHVAGAMTKVGKARVFLAKGDVRSVGAQSRERVHATGAPRR
jgi:hypothetical protein